MICGFSRIHDSRQDESLQLFTALRATHVETPGSGRGRDAQETATGDGNQRRLWIVGVSSGCRDSGKIGIVKRRRIGDIVANRSMGIATIGGGFFHTMLTGD